MTGSDRFLAAIVIGILVLVVVAFAVVLRQPEPTYRGTDTAAGAAHDYLLALRERDFERAYGLLWSGVPGRPADLQAFVADVNDQRWSFGLEEQAASFRVGDARPAADGAEVEVVRTVFVDGGLLDSAQRTERFHLTLQQEGGAWRVAGGERFFHHCWSQPEDCRRSLATPAPIEVEP